MALEKMKQMKENIVGNRGHLEGPIARSIEDRTARIPSDVFLGAAVASMAASAILQIMGKKERSLFVGQWAPAFLLLGVYNKIVKVQGSDTVSRGEQEDLDLSLNAS